ncbi:MAG: IPT/TIG domain-containing protein [Acidimicrobiales bacterium]
MNSVGAGENSAEVYATPEQPGPVASSVTPSSGSSAGHRYIEIFGTNLSPGGKLCLWYLGTGCSGVSVCVGGNEGLVVYASSTELLVLWPLRAPGTVDITVAADGQSSATSPKDQCIYV